MKRNFFIVIIFTFIFTTQVFSQNIREKETLNIGKYKFKLYLLIKGKKKKTIEKPKFGYRLLKTFPLRVKEFTFSARYYNYLNDFIKTEAPDIILKDIKKWRRKNAYHISNKIYEYIKNNIKDRKIDERIINSPHKLYYSGVKALRKKKGNNLEKCRLAVTLLRFFTIPARVSFFKDHYVVEYFLRPLKGNGNWFIMDFKDEENKNKFIEPISWHPIDKKELLKEEWRDNLYLKELNRKRIYLPLKKETAIEMFNEICEDDKKFDDSIEKLNTKRFVFAEIIEYELWINLYEKKNTYEAEFTLPFNIIDEMRTVKFYLKSLDENLKIKYTRGHSRVNVPQRGLVYTLPVKFIINNN